MDYRKEGIKMIYRVNRTLLDDIEKIYFSIPCASGVRCECCKNKLMCDIVEDLMKSLKKFYKGR